MRIKSKGTIIYVYGHHNKCCVTINPRQKWDIVGCKRDYVVIRRQGIQLEIPIDDYEKYFEGVK